MNREEIQASRELVQLSLFRIRRRHVVTLVRQKTMLIHGGNQVVKLTMLNCETPQASKEWSNCHFFNSKANKNYK